MAWLFPRNAPLFYARRALRFIHSPNFVVSRVVGIVSISPDAIPRLVSAKACETGIGVANTAAWSIFFTNNFYEIHLMAFTPYYGLLDRIFLYLALIFVNSPFVTWYRFSMLIMFR